MTQRTTVQKKKSTLERPSVTKQSKQSNDAVFQLSRRIGNAATLQFMGNGKNSRKEPVVSQRKSGLPGSLKHSAENASGYSMDDVVVNYNSDKPVQMDALAYTQANQIYIAPGQEQTLKHELGHVVQQKQGRVQPTTRVGDVAINDNSELEREADHFSETMATGSIFNTEKQGVQTGTDAVVAQRIRIRVPILREGQFGLVGEETEIKDLDHIKTSDVKETGAIMLNGDFNDSRETVRKISINKEEDIIFQGHANTEQQGIFSADQLAELAYLIQKPVDWSGQIVLMGCSSGPMAQPVSKKYFELSGKAVTVSGTKRTLTLVRGKQGKPETYSTWMDRPELTREQHAIFNGIKKRFTDMHKIVKKIVETDQENPSAFSSSSVVGSELASLNKYYSEICSIVVGLQFQLEAEQKRLFIESKTNNLPDYLMNGAINKAPLPEKAGNPQSLLEKDENNPALKWRVPYKYLEEAEFRKNVIISRFLDFLKRIETCNESFQNIDQTSTHENLLKIKQYQKDINSVLGEMLEIQKIPMDFKAMQSKAMQRNLDTERHEPKVPFAK